MQEENAFMRGEFDFDRDIEERRIQRLREEIDRPDGCFTGCCDPDMKAFYVSDGVERGDYTVHRKYLAQISL